MNGGMSLLILSTSLQIYALNEVMKKFEEEKFREFISGRV